MPLSDDPLNNASPKTRQRFEDALERRRSKEGRFQVSPSLVMQQVQSSDSQVWAHWEYSAEEWALFEKIDWKPASRKFWLSVGLSSLFLPDVAALIWSASYNVYPVLVFSIVFIFISVVLFIALAVYSHIYGEAKKRHKARQQDQPHRVTISKQGMWEAGTYFPLDEHDFVLDEVKMTPQPPVLHFRRVKQFSGTENTPLPDTLRVLVPRGHEEEAASLIARFRTEVIEAQKQAWQRLMNPPEPL